MKRIVLTLCVFIALSTVANAGEMFRCVDRDGSTLITNTPQDGMKCVSRSTDRDVTSGRIGGQANSQDETVMRMKRQQRVTKAKMQQQHKKSYMTKDAFGIPVNSDNPHMTRDAFGIIVNSNNPHMTKDAFGMPVNSDTPHLTKDAFGTIIMSK